MLEFFFRKTLRREALVKLFQKGLDVKITNFREAASHFFDFCVKRVNLVPILGQFSDDLSDFKLPGAQANL